MQLPEASGDGGVTIRLDAPDLGTFLKNTLQAPKTVGGFRFGSFVLRRNDIEVLHNLVNERIDDQNDGAIMQFSVSIYFKDGKRATLNSLEDFQRYAEPRNVLPVSVNLSWTYLVKYPGSDAPERLEINITFYSSQEVEDLIDVDLSAGSMKFRGDTRNFVSPFQKTGLGSVMFLIEHTRPSLGMDLENIIDNHISKFIEKPSKPISMFKNTLGLWVDLSTAIIGVTIVSLVIVFLSDFFISEIALASEIEEMPLRELIEISSILLIALIAFRVFVSNSIRPIIGKSLERLAQPKPSFIIVSEHNEISYSKILKKKRWLTGSAVGVIIIDIISATIFAITINNYIG